MDAEVVRVIMEITAFFALAAAGIWGFPFAGFGMAALAAALLVPAMDARDYAEILHLFRCDESCDVSRGWSSTEDAWQWDGLWIAAVVGIVTLWISVALGVAAGAIGVLPRARRIARRAHLVATVPMAIATASFGVFTLIVSPFGDRYGI
jgi:hypothetical protein